MADRFISRTAIEQFVDLFLRQTLPFDLENLQREYIRVCHDNPFCGSEIGLSPPPPNLGHVVDRASFMSRLVRNYGITPERAAEITDRLESSNMEITDWEQIATFRMRDYGTWVTWDLASNGVRPPFAFLKDDNPSDIRNALGLPADHAAVCNLPLLGFEYHSTNVAALYRPTVADAADSLRFAVRLPPPPDHHDWYGLTVPWQDFPGTYRPTAIQPTYPPKRPEAIHKPIHFVRSLICKRYPGVLTCEGISD